MNKEELIKDILSIRRRVDVSKGRGLREIDVFEEQIEKSLKRIEQAKYLAKKFNEQELVEIHQAYDNLRSKPSL